LKKNGRIELFKTHRDQPDDEVTLETICDKLIIHGTAESVATVAEFPGAGRPLWDLALCRPRTGRIARWDGDR